MVIIEETKDIFKTDCTIIAHQISNKGGMNGGLITKKIKKIFPHVYEEYKHFKKFSKESKLGKVIYIDSKEGHIIANMVSLNYVNGKKKTDYEAFEQCCISIKNMIDKKDTGIYLTDKFSVAFPYGIGSDRDGEGDWEIIQSIIYRIFGQPEDTDAVCKIYKNLGGK